MDSAARWAERNFGRIQIRPRWTAELNRPNIIRGLNGMLRPIAEDRVVADRSEPTHTVGIPVSVCQVRFCEVIKVLTENITRGPFLSLTACVR